jgi:hypothetical protein
MARDSRFITLEDKTRRTARARLAEELQPPNAAELARKASRSIGGSFVGAYSRSSRTSEQPPTDDREAIERAVRNGRKTPLDAERWALENGRIKFAPLLDEHSWDFEKRLWPFPLAAIWIACRNNKRAIQSWSEFCFWRGHVIRNALSDEQEVSFERAEFDLLQELENGELTAEGRRRARQSQKIESGQWHSAHWADASTRDVMVLRDGEEYSEIVVPRKDALALWPPRRDKPNGSTRSGNVSAEKLHRFLLNGLSGRKTFDEYLELSLNEFPLKNVPHKLLRAQLKKLPEDRKVGRGKRTQKHSD